MNINRSMRTVGMIIGIIVFLFALAGYAGWHLWRMAPQGWKLAAVILFALWMASFFLGFAYMERLPLRAATILYEVGNTWLIAFMYLLIVFFLADLASLCHLLPKAFMKDSPAGLLSVLGLVALILVLGGIHYHHKYREEITLTTSKPLEKPLTIVMASDLHIGYHNGKAELGRWVDLVNAEQPDLVLIGGDLVDRSLRPILEGHFEEELRRIDAPTYAVLGNHEYFGDLERAERFFNDADIILLKDRVANDQGISIIGRDDRSNPQRARLKELVQTADCQDGFTLVLDHQPNHLEEAAEAGIDFQFSGHTHHGQVWPISWVTDLLFEKSWGHYRKGATTYYISSGLGIWGAKIRVGTRSEYLVLHLINQ